MVNIRIVLKNMTCIMSMVTIVVNQDIAPRHRAARSNREIALRESG